MYLLKELGYNHFEKRHEIQNGINCVIARKSKRVLVCSEFWGQTEVNLGEFADISKFEKSRFAGEIVMTYVNEYFVKDIEDNFKKFIFNVSTYQPDNIEGYIIFSKNSCGVKTNGKKLFQRYSNEIVVSLQEGEYLEYDGGRVEVNNHRLMLVI